MKHYWAKTAEGGIPGISVTQHNQTVGVIAGLLVDQFPFILKDAKLTRDAVAFLASTHDVGKISFDFQQKSQVWLEQEGLLEVAERESWKTLYQRSHPLISQQSLKKFLFDHIESKISSAVWAAIVGAHHGNVVEVPTSRPISFRQPQKALEDERQKAIFQFYSAFGFPQFSKVTQDSSEIWAVAGLIVLADWIGSDEEYFPANLTLSLKEIEDRGKQAISAIGLEMPQIRHGLKFRDIFQGREPYLMQQQTHDLIEKGGVYVVEAPMGMGKTEAALYAAYKLLDREEASGIYFALPSQATSNRMFLRFADYVRHICSQFAPTTLLHSNSWLANDLKKLAIPESVYRQRDYQWFNGSRRAMFAPFGVGTVDQALQAILPVRYFQLRRFALENKVVIIDEVHSYDSYTSALVNFLCRELPKLGCTVILLSATLTNRVRCRLLDIPEPEENESLLPYPRLTGINAGVDADEKTPPAPEDKIVRIFHEDITTVIQAVSDAVLKGAKVLWICDTVDSAQQTYLRLKERLSTADEESYCGLLHARFPFFIRDRLEQKWMTRFGRDQRETHGAVLVSTQIVEQSVDLDADIMVSELAPTDILLQRLGRLWRHSRGRRVVEEPTFYLLREGMTCSELKGASKEAIKRSLGTKGFVYSPYVLLRAEETWTGLQTLKLPSDIRRIMAASYADKVFPPSWEELRVEQEGDEMASRAWARMNSNIWSDSRNDDARLPSRLSDRKEFLLVLCCIDDKNQLHLKEKYQEINLKNTQDNLTVTQQLHRSAIKISETRLDGFEPDSNLRQRFAIDGLLVIDEHGLATSVAGKDCRIVWDEELGIKYEKVNK